jgi:hypothetical protein
MKPNTYKILTECIDNGIKAGWFKAHKHTDTPTPEQVWDSISHYVMLEVCDYFIFDNPNE